MNKSGLHKKYCTTRPEFVYSYFIIIPIFSRSSLVFSNLDKLDTPTHLKRIETMNPHFTAPFALALMHEFPSTPIISISETPFDLRYEISSSDEKASACLLQNTLSDARMRSSANSSVTIPLRSFFVFLIYTISY